MATWYSIDDPGLPTIINGQARARVLPPGVTRKDLERIAGELGIPIVNGKITYESIQRIVDYVVVDTRLYVADRIGT
jgi:hypothetical protein